MSASRSARVAVAVAVLAAVALPAVTGTASAAPVLPVITPVPFAAAAPGAIPAQTKPDDVTVLDGHVFTPFQNGVGPNGESASGGGSQSTVAEYDATGHQVATYLLTGRCDGLTADPARHRVLASINEDSNSSLAVITPANATAAGSITSYAYSPSPAETSSTDTSSHGGTDSLAVSPQGRIFVSHSNPNTGVTGTAAVDEVTLTGSTAVLTKVLAVDGTATDAITGLPATLALTDPDSNRYLPADAPVLPGTLLQVAQGDSKIIEISAAGTTDQQVKQLALTSAEPGTAAPTIDDVVEVTGPGTLYAVDQGAGTIQTIDTNGLRPGTLVVAQPAAPADNTTTPTTPATPGQLGVLDPTTGVISHFPNTFTSPKGLAFVPREATPPPPLPETTTAVLLPLAALGLLAIATTTRGRRRRATSA